MTFINGTTDSEILYGTSEDDSIYGLAGVDTVYGYGGNDEIKLQMLATDVGTWKAFGGAGDDKIGGFVTHFLFYGELGNDHLSVHGNTFSNSKLYGGPGNDYIYASDSQTGFTLIGGAGRDSISGTWGDDVIRGGPGHDELNGSKGDDTIYGGLGWDTIDGVEGKDHIWAGRGADTIRINGLGERDRAHGGYGNDTFYFDSSDVVWGNAGADKFYVGGGRIKDFQPGIDHIFLDSSQNDALTFHNYVEPFLYNTAAGVKM